MARFTKKPEVAAKKEPIEIYVAPMKTLSFVVKILDESGKLVPMIDPHSRAQKLMEDGTPCWVEKTIKFNNVVENVSKGALCEYKVYDDTPAYIRERLEELHADSRSSVMTREEWIQERNPEYYNEIQRRKSLEKELSEKYLTTISEKDRELAEMRAKLAELEPKVD